MKSTIIHLTIAAFALIAAVPQAEARTVKSRIYISGYTSRGNPIYTERYCIGYDHCGNPVWRYRTVRQTYRPRYVAPCPAPVVYCAPPRSGTRIVIQGSFGR